MTDTAGSQWLRKASLYVVPTSGSPALDLSQLHFRFQITAADVETPNNAVIRIYNPADRTANLMIREFTQVILQAGYQAPGVSGQIFKGTIKQYHRGRERNVDSYIDVFAADLDLLHNYAVLNKTLAAGAGPQDQAAALNEQVETFGGKGLDETDTTGLTGGILPRGKVLFGLWADSARDLARTTGTTWSVQNGQLIATPLTGYRAGDVVKINSRTGMIGQPQSTQNGITVTTLLNPRIRIGQRVQINNGDINTVTQLQQGFPTYTGIQLFAPTDADGIYRVLVHEMVGDTRGQEWYSNLVCLAVNPTAQPANSVQAQ